MNHLAPTVGNAQLYSPTAASNFFDNHLPSKLAVLSTDSAANLAQPLLAQP